MSIPPYYPQVNFELPDPVQHKKGITPVVLQNKNYDIGIVMKIGSTGLVSVVDVPAHSNTNDGLFYVARYDGGYNIDILATRQVGLKSNGDTLLVENKGSTDEIYRWSVLHLN